jgi:hypothetical protein
LALNKGIVRVAGDLLAAAFEVWGVVVCASLDEPGRSPGRRLTGAAALFVLAVFTKATMISGLAACLIWLHRSGARRRALGLAATFGVGASIAAALVSVASHGHIVEVMRASASGGATVVGVLKAPLAFWENVSSEGAVLLVVAAALVVAFPKTLGELLTIWLFCATVVTIGIYGSPGTAANHLVLLDVATLVFISVAIRSGRLPERLGLAIVGLAGALGLVSIYRLHRPPADSTMADVVREVTGPSEQPLLCENPWVAILAGEQPYLIDAFSFRLAAARRPEMARDLLERLDHRSFRAIVLSRKLVAPLPEAPAGWYRDVHFGPGFAEKVLANYALASEHRYLYVYRPRP